MSTDKELKDLQLLLRHVPSALQIPASGNGSDMIHAARLVLLVYRNRPTTIAPQDVVMLRQRLEYAGRCVGANLHRQLAEPQRGDDPRFQPAQMSLLEAIATALEVNAATFLPL